MKRVATRLVLVGSQLLLLVLALVCQAVAQSCVQPPPGMIGWWPGDGNPNDIVGTHNGILVGNTTFTTGMVGQAFHFPGSDVVVSHIEVRDTVDLQISGPLSLDAWVSFDGVAPQTPDVSNGPVVSKWGDSIYGTAGYGLFIDKNGTVLFLVSSDGTTFSITASPDLLQRNAFYHLAGVYTGSRLELYVNAVLVDTANFSGPVHGNNGSPLAIGGHFIPFTHANDTIIGDIDEVEVFNRALSGAEVQAIFSAGSAGKCKPTLGVPPAHSAQRKSAWFSRLPTPNPTGGGTTFAITLAEPNDARVEVTDMAGRRVATIQSGTLSAGDHRFEWSGRDASGAIVPTGVYLIGVEVGGARLGRKLVLRQ